MIGIMDMLTAVSGTPELLRRSMIRDQCFKEFRTRCSSKETAIPKLVWTRLRSSGQRCDEKVLENEWAGNGRLTPALRSLELRGHWGLLPLFQGPSSTA
jgi:hypothetical protein